MIPSASCSAPHRAFVVSCSDNVATLLDDAQATMAIQLLGEIGSPAPLLTREHIPASHKIALHDIAQGEAVIKYGYRIGHATQPICAGEWVHLHNCASDVDERSNTLDVHTGVPSDTRSSYE